jgi:hypothetical protein
MLRCETAPIGHQRSAAAKNARGVPDAVAAALNVVAVTGVSSLDGRPMAGRLPPAMHAVDARVEQVLVGPTFGDNFDWGAGPASSGQTRENPLKAALPVMMALHLGPRLIARMAVGLIDQDRIVAARGTAGRFWMNPHREDHAPLSKRAGRQIQQNRYMRRAKAIVLARTQPYQADHLPVVRRGRVGKINDGQAAL